MSSGIALQTLVFGIGDGLFALPISMVREILDHRLAFRVPDAPRWLAGLCDVRGRSIPMVDLRICLGLAPVAASQATRVLVVEADAGGDGLRDIGLCVDRVIDVSTWPPEAVEPVPHTGTGWRSRHIASVLRRHGDFVGLLDLAGIFAGMDSALAVAAPLPRAAA